MNEQQLIKGYNNGYFLAEHRPELLNALMKGITSENSPYLEGLQEGQQQRKKEKERERIKNSIARGSNGRDKDKDRSR